MHCINISKNLNAFRTKIFAGCFPQEVGFIESGFSGSSYNNSITMDHREFTFVVSIQFWNICFSGIFPLLPHSHTLLVFLSLSLSLPPLSLFLSLRFFPPFLSFHLRLFNLFNDHSPSPLSPPLTP